ncbi:MAG: serine/threonine-protein kinase [candidate division Zixibacteria bacterium]|nr:serine/threonine-protein kinase [candidate division Zixibacteria bacterium]
MQPDDDKTQAVTVISKGTVIGHYRIVEKIGAGGMGEVYLAEDTSLNRQVALKFLSSHLCQDADCRTRFKREAQAAAKLDHPNIVTVYEVGEFQGRPFFAMQHIEGRSLREHASHQELSIPQVLEIGIQIAEGLQAAHEKGVTHRDIKPANVLIDSHGRARILDFGLASVAGTDHLTKTGSTLGTIGYMSPEQVRGEQVDHRTDIFSLGVVLYELIAGRQPFKGDNDTATSRNIIDHEPEPLARYKSGVNAEFQRVISKTLAKDKSVRYQHADDLAADMKQLLSPSGPLPVKRSRRMRIVAPLLIVIVLSAIALIFKPWELVNKSSDEATTENRRVVVVPFRNQTGDPSLDPLGKMVADWTTQGLLQTGLAEVVPPDVVPGFDANKDVREIAAAAGVGTIILGSYYKVGDSIQFQSQVMKADGSLLQAIDPIYAPKAKVMDGVESVRQRILGALMFVFDKRLEGETNMSNPPTYEAYLQYMQGLELWDKKLDLDPAGTIPYFKRAYALDTTFISPLLAACMAYSQTGQYAQMDSLVKILELRGAQLSPLQQLDLDKIRAELAGDLMGMLASMRAMVKLSSVRAIAYELGYIALIVNRPKETVESFKKVDPEMPWVPFWAQLARAYHMLGEHEKELESAREGRRRFPTSPFPYYSELYALAAMERMDELRELIGEQTNFRNFGTPAYVRRIAAEELRAHGHEDQAMTLLDEAIRWYESQSPEKLDSLRGSYALTLNYARRWDKAKTIYEELAKKFPKDSAAGQYYESVLGIIAARQGDRTRAMEVSEWLKNLRVPYLFGENTYNRACIAAILGDKEQAVALLKESFLQGKAFGLGVHKDFDFESLWDYQPFIEFLKPKG